MVRSVPALLAAVLLSASAAFAAPQSVSTSDTPTLPPADDAFVRDAVLAALVAMDLDYEALTSSKRDDVRAFALDAASVHAPGLYELTRLAIRFGVTAPASLDDYPAYVPDRPWVSDADHFDALFMSDQERRLRDELDTYNREAYYGSDEALRTFAQSRVVDLGERLDTAHAILAKLDSDTAR